MEKAKQKESIGEGWQNPEIFEHYNTARKLFRDTAKDLIVDIFKDDVSESGPIVELGSGVGELENLVSEKYANRLIGLERTKRFGQINKMVNKDANLVVGDIEQLPIQDEATDSVVSFAVFDTLDDLDKSMSEVKRVLKSKGKFVHMIDLQPNAHIVMDRLPEGMIPFPNFEGGTISGFRLVKLEDFERIKDEIDPLRRPMIDLYVDNPMYTYAYLEQNDQRINIDIAETVKKWGFGNETVEFGEAFSGSMEKSIENNGLKLVKSEIVTKEKIIDRDEKYDEFPNYNYFENNLGSVFKRYDPSVPAGKVKVISRMQVIVAEKV